jgi:hypothetical protein
MPTESVFIRKRNREKLRKAEEKTGLSLARLINLLVEEGYLDELLTKHRKTNLRSAFWRLVVSSVICDHTGLGETDRQLKLGMPETYEIKAADLLKRAEISATTRVQYVRPDEVRKILVKMGFELTESEETEPD